MNHHCCSPLFLQAAGVCLLSLLFAAAGMGDVLIHKNLQDMVSQAEAIISGTCLSAHDGSQYFPEVGIIGYTEYAFSVEEWIKGRQNDSVVVLRQPRALASQSLTISNATQATGSADSFLRSPMYMPGLKYVLFLHAANEWGLTSPVGSVQGVFNVTQEPDGELSLANGIGNVGLFRAMEPLAAGAQQSLADPGRASTSESSKARVRASSFLSLARSLAKKNINR